MRGVEAVRGGGGGRGARANPGGATSEGEATSNAQCASNAQWCPWPPAGGVAADGGITGRSCDEAGAGGDEVGAVGGGTRKDSTCELRRSRFFMSWPKRRTWAS